MMRTWTDKCTICGREDVMRYQCRKCNKWACGETTCVKLIQAASRCFLTVFHRA